MIAYTGGLSAASGLIIVTALALSSMLLNHLILPVYQARPVQVQTNIYRWLTNVRRVLIAALILSSYGFYRLLHNEVGYVQPQHRRLCGSPPATARHALNPLLGKSQPPRFYLRYSGRFCRLVFHLDVATDYGTGAVSHTERPFRHHHQRWLVYCRRLITADQCPGVLSGQQPDPNE